MGALTRSCKHFPPESVIPGLPDKAPFITHVEKEFIDHPLLQKMNGYCLYFATARAEGYIENEPQINLLSIPFNIYFYNCIRDNQFQNVDYHSFISTAMREIVISVENNPSVSNIDELCYQAAKKACWISTVFCGMRDIKEFIKILEKKYIIFISQYEDAAYTVYQQIVGSFEDIRFKKRKVRKEVTQEIKKKLDDSFIRMDEIDHLVSRTLPNSLGMPECIVGENLEDVFALVQSVRDAYGVEEGAPIHFPPPPPPDKRIVQLLSSDPYEVLKALDDESPPEPSFEELYGRVTLRKSPVTGKEYLKIPIADIHKKYYNKLEIHEERNPRTKKIEYWTEWNEVSQQIRRSVYNELKVTIMAQEFRDYQQFKEKVDNGSLRLDQLNLTRKDRANMSVDTPIVVVNIDNVQYFELTPDEIRIYTNCGYGHLMRYGQGGKVYLPYQIYLDEVKTAEENHRKMMLEEQQQSGFTPMQFGNAPTHNTQPVYGQNPQNVSHQPPHGMSPQPYQQPMQGHQPYQQPMQGHQPYQQPMQGHPQPPSGEWMELSQYEVQSGQFNHCTLSRDEFGRVLVRRDQVMGHPLLQGREQIPPHQNYAIQPTPYTQQGHQGYPMHPGYSTQQNYGMYPQSMGIPNNALQQGIDERAIMGVTQTPFKSMDDERENSVLSRMMRGEDLGFPNTRPSTANPNPPPPNSPPSQNNAPNNAPKGHINQPVPTRQSLTNVTWIDISQEELDSGVFVHFTLGKKRSSGQMCVPLHELESVGMTLKSQTPQKSSVQSLGQYTNNDNVPRPPEVDSHNPNPFLSSSGTTEGLGYHHREEKIENGKKVIYNDYGSFPLYHNANVTIEGETQDYNKIAEQNVDKLRLYDVDPQKQKEENIKQFVQGANEQVKAQYESPNLDDINTIIQASYKDDLLVPYHRCKALSDEYTGQRMPVYDRNHQMLYTGFRDGKVIGFRVFPIMENEMDYLKLETDPEAKRRYIESQEKKVVPTYDWVDTPVEEGEVKKDKEELINPELKAIQLPREVTVDSLGKVETDIQLTLLDIDVDYRKSDRPIQGISNEVVYFYNGKFTDTDGEEKSVKTFFSKLGKFKTLTGLHEYFMEVMDDHTNGLPFTVLTQINEWMTEQVNRILDIELDTGCSMDSFVEDWPEMLDYIISVKDDSEHSELVSTFLGEDVVARVAYGDKILVQDPKVLEGMFNGALYQFKNHREQLIILSQRSLIVTLPLNEEDLGLSIEKGKVGILHESVLPKLYKLCITLVQRGKGLKSQLNRIRLLTKDGTYLNIIHGKFGKESILLEKLAPEDVYK